MPKKITLKKSPSSSKEFDKAVTKYQDSIAHSERGEIIKQSAKSISNIDLSSEQVAYIQAVMTVSENRFVEYGKAYVPIPVRLLFTMMTPYKTTEYDIRGKWSKQVKYMAGVTERCVERLGDIVFVRNKQKGKCRRFALNINFSVDYYLLQQSALETVVDNYQELNDNKSGMHNYPRGDGFQHINRLHPITVATVDKIRDSRFVFDAEFYHSQQGKEFIKSKDLTKGQIDSLYCTLQFLNKYTNSPQYHQSFHLQSAGRMHTVGGCIQLPKWFRDRFILPVNPNNVRVEFDLKCAQLLILCEILKIPSLKNQILEILEADKSIWPSIGDPDMEKRIKKIIVYAFCFGGAVKNLPFLGSREARVKELNTKVTKKEVSQCLGGILEPLVTAREEWLQQYTINKILHGNLSRRILNDLSRPYSLYQEACQEWKEAKKENNQGNSKRDMTQARLNSTKIGSLLLAHLAQGKEQNVIQTLIAGHVDENILTFQYDGFTLEVEPGNVHAVIDKLQENCMEPLEAQIDEHTSNQASK